MCGIAGLVSFADALPPGFSGDQVLQALRHRGPDEQGEYRESHLWLGMRRLSIVDLTGGKQPVFDERRQRVAIFNGEIYNYVELREELRVRGHVLTTRSDTEVLPHLFEELGEAFPSKLRGMFAIALWDSSARTLYLCRDRFGKKPLYYFCDRDGRVAFASELKALRLLAEAVGFPLEIDETSVYDYLSLGTIVPPATVYKNVQALLPGGLARFSAQGCSVRRYWEPAFTPKFTGSFREAASEVRGLVHEATRLRLRSDVPVGVFLSGGLDSTVVAWEAARLSERQLLAFTIGVDDPALDERAFARQTAARFGLQHLELPVRVAPADTVLTLAAHFDQPFADPSAIVTFEVARLARQHVKVVLNGDGGDEIFAGYRRYWAASWAGRVGPLGRAAGALLAKALPKGPRRSALGFATRTGRGLLLPPWRRWLVWTTDLLSEGEKARCWNGSPQRPTEERLPAVPDSLENWVDRHTWMDLLANLTPMLLVKMDMATMAHSLEARSPLLDHQLAEFCFRLPAAFKVQLGRRKPLLRAAYAREIPPWVANQPKRGFEVPLASWLAGDLRPLVEECLGSGHSALWSFLRKEPVHRWVFRRAPLAGNYAGVVYALLMLELWLRSLR